ncbi:MAG: hypothetical protein VCB77_03300, partial [Alphaproteobacteria bacterium]
DRNSGYLLDLWLLFPALKARFGRETVLAIGRASAAAIEGVISFCGDNAIDAEIRQRGWLWAPPANTTTASGAPWLKTSPPTR